MEVVLYFVWFSSIFTSTFCLYCLTCSDIEEARNCGNAVKCAIGQVCYSTQLITSAGRIYRKMGCRDATTCTHGVIVGKRQDGDLKSVFSDNVRYSTSTADGLGLKMKRSGDSTICDECCNSDLCQTGLCSDTDVVQRGPVCFNCGSQLPSVPCTTINRCDSDEFCFKSYTNSGHLLQSGCIFKTACEHHVPSVPQSSCWICCGHDLCNENCTSQATGTTTQGQICNDTTAEGTCRLAASIVCQDKIHADNAGCPHFCGFC